MGEQEWLDRVEQLSSTWKDRCALVFPTTDKYKLSRIIFEAVWRFNEWDLKILRECLEDNRNWMLFEAHQRLKTEGILRGFWVEECASDEELKNLVAVESFRPQNLKIRMATNFPKPQKIIADLRCKDVPYINKNSEKFLQLYQGGNDLAHMSAVLISSPLVDRGVYIEIKECLYQIGIGALMISRISWDESHVSIIENELGEALRQLDPLIQRDFST